MFATGDVNRTLHLNLLAPLLSPLIFPCWLSTVWRGSQGHPKLGQPVQEAKPGGMVAETVADIKKLKAVVKAYKALKSPPGKKRKEFLPLNPKPKTLNPINPKPKALNQAC